MAKKKTEKRPAWYIEFSDPLAAQVIEYFAAACDRTGRPDEARTARVIATESRHAIKAANQISTTRDSTEDSETEPP